ncbi:MAG: hypothetical protein KDB52_07810 [Solirubrobacterales bacterium]|nr:hypothetical protein [Solirubrobacterales bacterium]
MLDPKQSTSPAGKEAETARKPALTEKQRIEARRARQARRRRKPVEGNPLSKGMRVVGFEVRRTASFIGGSIIAGLAALGPVFSSVGMGLVWLIERVGEGLKVLARLIARVVAAAGRLAIALDRVITPHRALILVSAVAAVLLGISQYKGLGSIEIGQAGYSGIEDLARAPAIDKTTPAGVHTQIFVPIAAVAFLSVLVIALGGVGTMAKRLAGFRRLASMILVTIGLLTLVVTLLIDLPEATDTTEAALAYSGVQARILGGFWLELAAGAALAVTGLALLLEPSTGRARDRQKQSRERESEERPDAERDLERERRRERRLRDGKDGTMPGVINGGSA